MSLYLYTYTNDLNFGITVSPSAQQFQAISRHVDDHEVFQNLYAYDFAHTIIIVKHGRCDLPKSEGTWFFYGAGVDKF